jgi:hypothetical protein
VRRPGALLLVPLALGCAPAASGERPARASWQQPIESACPGGAQPSEELGLVTRTEFSRDAQARVVLSNASASGVRVVPERVAFCRGPCAGRWNACRQQRKFDATERSRYDVALAPGESIELLVDARLPARGAGCEKAGLFLIAEIDGTKACSDAGAWIVQAAE